MNADRILMNLPPALLRRHCVASWEERGRSLALRTCRESGEALRIGMDFSLSDLEAEQGIKKEERRLWIFSFFTYVCGQSDCPALHDTADRRGTRAPGAVTNRVSDLYGSVRG